MPAQRTSTYFYTRNHLEQWLKLWVAEIELFDKKQPAPNRILSCYGSKEASRGAGTKKHQGNQASSQPGTTNPTGPSHVGTRAPKEHPYPHCSSTSTPKLATRISHSLNDRLYRSSHRPDTGALLSHRISCRPDKLQHSHLAQSR
ncbi:hypothetical protein PCASD_05965 [Puccinia coronata f. sp. avenae]|uniref:Uncharacterized protein n=1 Tax=Puccinia coronata f. sp. avenae TaxID=200324 RepID=A0A2N5V656_9BASI|nr:hypothetical protein PCASD_05965 [Puccinia coronata f. sp. avenae]